MTNQHPIVPPPELVTSWIECDGGGQNAIRRIATRAAQWGADQELEACCEWLRCPDNMHLGPSDLRADRRPKPPSLAEEALDALEMHFAAIGEGQCYQPAHKITIRRALERLQELEDQQ